MMIYFSKWKLPTQKYRLTDADMLAFFRQFSALFSAGIAILKICELLERNQINPTMRHIIYHIKQHLVVGQSFAACIKTVSAFDPLIYQLIQIGEQTGKLDSLLKTIINYIENKLFWKRKIKQALFYPVVIFTLAIILTLGILVFVIPKFADLFSELNTSLPFMTRCIFYISASLKKVMIFLSLLALISTLVLYKKYTHYKIYLWYRILKLPIVRHYYHLFTITQFTRYLAITLGAGIPILDAITLSGSHLPEQGYHELSFQLCQRIQVGQPLSSGMLDSHFFPPFVIQMVKSGEDSGKLIFMLEKVSHVLEEDLTLAFNRLSQLLEPLIMLVLGVLIGGIMVGMYLPIFQLGSTL